VKKIKSQEYSQQYFLNDCEGWNQWLKSNGKKLSPRLKYSVNLVPVGEGMRILDFGCGRGEVSIWAARQGTEVYAVDYAPAALKLFKKSLQKVPTKIKKRIHLIKASAESLEMEENFLDLVYFLDVFEHLNNRQLAVILTKFFLYLKPGGKLVIHTAPNKKFLDYGYPLYTRWINWLVSPFWCLFFKEGRTVASNPRSDYDKRVHINEQTKNSVAKRLKEAGFNAKTWTDSRFHLVRIRDKLDYWLLRPIWLPGLKEVFAWDIWAIGEKPQ